MHKLTSVSFLIQIVLLSFLYRIVQVVNTMLKR